ncbi:MAG: HupE/UreJ family protein [Gammaproteobacteria bacterium]
MILTHRIRTGSGETFIVIIQGILHLLTGFDHLAFLLVALLGVVRKRDAHDPRPLRTAMLESLKVVTAFTVAHSITLTLSALGVVMLASKPVEASIAATVFITALSGFWKPSRFHGWPLAAAFGLVHGFGFAGALSQLVGDKAQAVAIGSFNLGIEMAQVAVALALVPALYVLTRKPKTARFVAPAISGVVAVVAATWLIQRMA